jgi:hypothetical protein
MKTIQFLSLGIDIHNKSKYPEKKSNSISIICHKRKLTFALIMSMLLQKILCHAQKLEIIAQNLSELNNPFVYKNSLYFLNPLSKYNNSNGFTTVSITEGFNVITNDSYLLNEELYYWLSFTNNNETRYKLAKLDDIAVSLIPNSTCLSTYSPLLLNEKIYLNYLNSSNKKQISIYNQSATTLVANPDSRIGAVDCPFIYNNVVYTKYQNIYKKNLLGKCDSLMLSIIANPDSGYGLFGPLHLIYNDTLLFYYKNLLNKIQLAKYDGKTLSLIANPDSGSIDTTNFQTVAYNHLLFFLYRDNSNKVQIAKYDGERLSLLSNPESINIYTSNFQRVTCNDSLLFKFKSATNQVQLVKCDGKSISSILPSDPNLVFNDIAFIYKNVPYLRFSNSTKTQCFIAKYDGASLTLFPNSSNGINKIDSLFAFKDNLYLLVNDQIAKLENSSYSTIPYPSCGGNCITKYSSTIPPLFINNRLFLSLVITVQLSPNPRYLVNYVEFDGSGFSLVKSKEVTFGGYAFKKLLEYKNNLYYTLKYTAGMIDGGESGIFRTDGNRKITIDFDDVPDISYRYSIYYYKYPIYYQDTLYIIQICYQTSSTWNSFPRYPSSPTNVRLWRLNEDEPIVPTIQASDVKISNITHNSLDISWKNGNGSSRVVFIEQKGSIPTISDHTYYQRPITFGLGGCAYNGNDSIIQTHFDLYFQADYDVYVYEYNGSPNCERYNTSKASGNPSTFSIPKLDQTIVFNPLPTKSFGDNDFNPGATASSGLPITYTSLNEAVATITNGLIHITGLGSTHITASQAGNDIYGAACDITQTLIVTAITGEEILENLYKIKIYPNPTFDFVQLDSPQTIQKLTIYNSQGKVGNIVNLNSCKSNLDFSNLPTGIYLIKVQTAKNTYVQKMVKK